MLDRLHSVSTNPDILIDQDKKLSELFMDMVKAFYKSTNECDFHPISINGKEELYIPERSQKYFVWEQLNYANQELLNAVQGIDIYEEEANNEEEEEEEEGNELLKDNDEDLKGITEKEKISEKIGKIDDDNDINNDNDEEEEKEDFKGSIAQIHISDLENNGNDEEEDQMEMIEDGEDSSEFDRLLLEENDEKGDQQYNYEDLYGNAYPLDNKEIDEVDEKSKKIKEIEEKLISKKPWEMNGETVAASRPLDSLADIDIDFDFTSTEPPAAPPTSELEKLLIARIESMNFDDVVRRKKPTESAREIYQINTERPKIGLADEYANDYIKRSLESGNKDTENELTAQQKEAIDLWHSLEHELNRFTERRFVSRRPRESITISHGTSLDVEEKPEATKAPEEIMAPVGSTRQMKGDMEVSHDERKATRRVKKEKKMKEQTAKDAAKGILFTEKGMDGAEVKLQKDVQKLLKGQLNDVEVVKPGEAISATKEKPKNLNNKFLL